MKERDLGHREQIRQLELATELRTTSDMLSCVIPRGATNTWHVVSPRFDEPEVNLLGYDVSPTLKELARSTTDLHVSHTYLEEDWDDSEHYPPVRIWEVFPPQGSGFLASYSSECTGEANMPGIGLAAYVPDTKETFNSKDLKKWVKDGYLLIDLLSWKKPGEGFPYRHDKPESVFMEVVQHDEIASLEVACWFLKGILKAHEIHKENVESYYHF